MSNFQFKGLKRSQIPNTLKLGHLRNCPCCQPNGICRIPPSPEVVKKAKEVYEKQNLGKRGSFPEFLESIRVQSRQSARAGKDDGLQPIRLQQKGKPQLIPIPEEPIIGTVKVKVLLVDFSDLEGQLPKEHYEEMLFSKGQYKSGSMNDFFLEASNNKVKIEGEVHGWLRMPNPYSYYTGGASGTDARYPNNAQRLAEDAVDEALKQAVEFPAELDKLGNGYITALFIVHAGKDAAQQADQRARLNNIWSHKWVMPRPVTVGRGLRAEVYLTVSQDCHVGVCAHELGHLAFSWGDFYDPNYDSDGKFWDGTGKWDLMAGGSYNGEPSGTSPAHPATLHKMQHQWCDVVEVDSTRSVTIPPRGATETVVKVTSKQYEVGQYLLLENRVREGFDRYLPGSGLLVWRVDERGEQMSLDRPGLYLVQADGKKELDSGRDFDSGDAGDPFPGSTGRTELLPTGTISTSFSNFLSSGISLRNIKINSDNSVSLDIEVGEGGEDGGSDDGDGRWGWWFWRVPSAQ